MEFGKGCLTISAKNLRPAETRAPSPYPSVGGDLAKPCTRQGGFVAISFHGLQPGQFLGILGIGTQDPPSVCSNNINNETTSNDNTNILIIIAVIIIVIMVISILILIK